DVHHERAIGREVVQLEVGRGVEVGRGRDRAVARLCERDRELVEVDEAQPQLAPQRRGHPLGHGNEGRRRRDLQLREIALHVRDTYDSPSSPLVCRIMRAAAASSSSRLRFAAATPSWIALPTGWSGSVTISRALCAASRAFCTGSLPDSSIVLLRKLSTWPRPGPDAMYAPATSPISPPRLKQPT